MQPFLFIAVGGATGAIARFVVANGIYGWLGRDFPHGTLFVNVTGSLLMGLMTELLLQRFAVAVEVRAAVIVGFIGAYTTFSTFALETFFLVEEGAYLKGIANVILSVGLCLAAVWGGQILGRAAYEPALVSGLMPKGSVLILLAGWVFLFVLTVLLTLTAALIAAPPEPRLWVAVGLLGLGAVLSTLWISERVVQETPELGTIGLVFGSNGLMAAATIWVAAKTGDWLWQRIL